MTRRDVAVTRGDEQAGAAARATYAAFTGAGFGFANWASRIPQVRDELHLSPSALGLVLLAIACGSLLALPLSGAIVARFGSRSTVAAMAVLEGVGLLMVAFGYLIGVPPVVVGLFAFGFATGAWDVAMNVQAAVVERRLGRPIMPRFHAGYSVGTVAGALVGAVMIILHVPVTVHLSVVGVAVAAGVPIAVRSFVPDRDDAVGTSATDRPGTALARWRETRTLLIGLMLLSFGFAEGAGNDWISVALIDGYHDEAVLGTIGFAVFLIAMTAGRWFGPTLLERHGRVIVIRAMAGVGVVGLLLFVYGSSTPLAFVGAALWGAGASLGFPVGMSAAADDAAAAPARVGVVSSIGYCAFLAGPLLIGALGDHVSVLRALVVVAGLLALALTVAGSVRPLAAAPVD